jgi:hypothetical protein
VREALDLLVLEKARDQALGWETVSDQALAWVWVSELELELE